MEHARQDRVDYNRLGRDLASLPPNMFHPPEVVEAAKRLPSSPHLTAVIGTIALLLALTGCARPSDSDGPAPISLPPEVSVPQDFVRNPDGLAADMGPAADERYQRCMEDLGLEIRPPASPSALDTEYLKWDMLCAEAAGTGWAPGNRPDEVDVLNQQAEATTSCVRSKGWDYVDPTLEPWGRFYRFDSDALKSLVPDNPDAASTFISDVRTCVDAYAIDWDEWVREHPRNR